MKKYGKRSGMRAMDTGARLIGKAALLGFLDKASSVLVFENGPERLVSKLLGFDQRVHRFLLQTEDDPAQRSGSG
ncbi:MAG: hypothetical protein QM742_03255 [Aquabacterium sp.]